MVIVDGLNEVSADTREKIGAFARDMSKGDVVVGSQPIEWRPPPNSRIVDLLPLSRAEAERFLRSRPVGADKPSHVMERPTMPRSRPSCAAPSTRRRAKTIAWRRN